MNSRLRRILLGLLVVYAAFLVYSVFADTETYQWDFRTYYYAAQADAQGVNPYDAAAVHRIAGGKYQLRFVYPPHTLYFFRPFIGFTYETAANLWLMLKLLLLAGLAVIWKRGLFPEERSDYFYLFLLFEFSATIYIDFVTGNVSIIEQFLLWLGIVFLLRKQVAIFCVLVIGAATFKLSLIGFLGILAFTDWKHKWRYLASSAAAFAALLLTGYALNPAGYERFFTAATAITERGSTGNPSIFALIRDSLELIAGKGGVLAADALAGDVVGVIVYAVAVLLILLVSYRSLNLIRNNAGEDKEQLVIFFLCLVYALIAPRFKTYSFILILPSAYYVLRRSDRFKAPGFLFILLVLTVHPPLPAALPIRPVLNLFWTYYPLGLAFLIWALFIALIRSDARPFAVVDRASTGLSPARLPQRTAPTPV